MKTVVLTLLICLFAAPAWALELALPVACTVGKDCWVQQYADHDPGPAAKDYACGIASYNGHDGTDIRVLHTGVEVAVLAAAAGRVKAVRDGVLDKLARTEVDRAAVAKIECGNGVVIDHGGGWETQYCHLRNGSVVVEAGKAVAAGDRLGLIGASGDAAFPHLHMTVRKSGKVVDPFSADDMTRCKAKDRTLWTSRAQKDLAYQDTTLLLLQWAKRIYDDDEIDTGALPSTDPDGAAPAIVVHATAINVHKDDEVTLKVWIPGQEPVINRVVMRNDRAVQRLHAGKKRRGDWPKGQYVAKFEIQNGGVQMMFRQIMFEMK